MLQESQAYSGFSVLDLATTKDFYSQKLEIEVTEEAMGLTLKLGSGAHVFIYPKKDHTPATYTILNFPVANIDIAVETLVAKGVVFEHYDGMTDDKGIARGISRNMGPDIAWFKDPSGNILSVLQEK